MADAYLQRRLRKILADQVQINPALVRLDAHLVADLHMDSLDRLELMVILEEEFAVTLTPEDVSVNTVQDVVDLVRGQMSPLRELPAESAAQEYEEAMQLCHEEGFATLGELIAAYRERAYLAPGLGDRTPG